MTNFGLARAIHLVSQFGRRRTPVGEAEGPPLGNESEGNESALAQSLAEALSRDDGSHKRHAEARDLLLGIVEDRSIAGLLESDLGRSVVRAAAMRCANLGPVPTAADLYRRLAAASNQAEDYYHLSEILTRDHGHLDESIAALSKAIELDPATYLTPSNEETVKLGRASLGATAPPTRRKKIGRYPTTGDFLGELEPLIKTHIACDLRSIGRFIRPETRFFTMGSCFARNVSRSLNELNYVSNHMEISEYINTTFANRAFIDWLDGTVVSRTVSERIEELLPAGWDAERMIETIRSSDVFILTLGVASAFFDRASGEFVLPRPTALNSRVLAERYLCRLTTVQENVANVMRVIKYARRLAPAIKIIVTVSPVPLMASFESESCVQADCLSKSTMRLAAHEIVHGQGIENILYWPSFEVFRWAGSNAGAFYAGDDGAAWHVSEDKVRDTIGAFVSMFGEPNTVTS